MTHETPPRSTQHRDAWVADVAAGEELDEHQVEQIKRMFGYQAAQVCDAAVDLARATGLLRLSRWMGRR